MVFFVCSFHLDEEAFTFTGSHNFIRPQQHLLYFKTGYRTVTTSNPCNQYIHRTQQHMNRIADTQHYTPLDHCRRKQS